jgi:hypothetical protein
MVILSKRGVSPIVANVLLTLLVLVIASLVFIWSIDFFSAQKEAAEVEKACRSIEFVSGQFCSNTISVYNLRTETYESTSNLEFDVRNTDTDSSIYGFLISVDYGGNTLVIPALETSLIEAQSSNRIVTSFIPDSGNIDKVSIIPTFNMKSKVFSCEEKESVVDWSEVAEC